MAMRSAVIRLSVMVVLSLSALLVKASICNHIAYLREWGRSLWGSGDMRPSIYDFDPSHISFSETGMVYRVKFCPKRALPHKVVVAYPKEKSGRWKNAQRITKGMAAEIILKHSDSDERFNVTNCSSALYQYGQVFPTSEIQHTLFRFRAAEFKWPYRDQIEIEIRLKAPAQDGLCSDKIDARIAVLEDFINK